jgi:hypothetical protein
MAEIWKDVVGWEGLYQVSDLGRVRSLDRTDTRGFLWRGKVLSLALSGLGPSSKQYYKVGMSRGSKVTQRRAHILVLEAFRGARPGGTEARHLDGNAHNNLLTNLVWGTPSENGRDRVCHGTQFKGETAPNAKFTETCAERMKDMRRAGCTVRSIARWFDTAEGYRGQILLGHRWAHV